MLAEFVASLTYKPGWQFKLAGPGSRYLCVFALTVDSQRPGRDRLTQHQFEFPDPLPDYRELARWVLDRLLLVEQHEACEFLRLDGFAPFYPHHQDDGSPYEFVERWEARDGDEIPDSRPQAAPL